MADYIKRDDALGNITLWAEGACIPTHSERGEAIDECLSLIRSCPPADVVERRKGRWKLYPYKAGILNMSGWQCSACGGITPVDVSRYKFCPNCGADLRGEKNEKRKENRLGKSNGRV